MIHLKLLGSPILEQNGSPLTELKNRKAAALLFYLALMPGEHQRHQIATLLWPDLPEEKALSNLRYNLWTLRQAVDDLPIEAGRLTIAFEQRADIWVDVNEFLGILKAKRVEVTQVADQLQEAIDLYRGDLLAGFELSGNPFFDEWLQERRTYFHLKTVKTLTRLSRDYAARQALPEAISATRRLLELEPWHEEAHHQLIHLLALAGQRTTALDHYEHYRQRLATEMDLEPEPETVALWRGIKEGQVRSIPPSTPNWSVNQVQLQSLFGRQREYAWLIEHWETVQRSNQGKWVLIKGEVGVGKTRLVEELGRYVEAQGGLWLSGRGYEFSGSLTYQPLATALRQKLPALLSPELTLSKIWLAELAQLLPEIYERFPDLPAPLTADRGANRHHLFEAATQFIRAMAARQPVLLFIDDLQWIDTDTLDLLAYLARRLAGMPLLLVGTSIPGEMTDDHPLMALRHALQQEALLDELGIGRLSREAVAQIVEERVVQTYDGDLSETLYKISEGNPFILFETLRELQETGLPAPPSGEQKDDVKRPMSIPVSVQAMIEKRLARLSVDSRHFLSVAAVIGNEFGAGLLATAADLPRQTVLDYLDEWLERHLVKEVNRPEEESADKTSLSSVEGRYDFSHALIRTVLYEELSQARRQSLHKQIGLALEKRYADQPHKIIEELARHYHRSNDSERALIYLQQAAQQAKAVYAWPIVLRRYRQALHHLEKLHGECSLSTPIGVWRQRWEFLLGQAEAHHMQGEVEEQLHLFEVTTQETTRWGDDEDKLRTIVQQLLYRPPLNDAYRYRALAEKGIALARSLIDGVSENVCRQALGDLDLEAARFTHALAHYELALVGEAQWKHPSEAALCLLKIGKTYAMTNRFSPAYICLQEAIAYAQAAPSPDLLVWSLLETMRVYLFVGNLNKAYDTGREALKLCREIGFRLAIPVGLGLESYLDTLTNRLDEAQVKGQQAWKMAQEIGDTQIMAEVQGHLGHFYLANEDPDQALTSFEQVRQLANGVSASRTIEALSYQALAHLALEQLEPAVACSHQAVDRLIGRQNNIEAAQKVYLNHYRILKATRQMVQAQVVLTQAQKIMHEQTMEIGLDESQPASVDAARQMFFANLPWNREIVANVNITGIASI